MIINIQQGDLSVGGKPVCRNGGVIDETISASIIPACMVTGRTAQGKSSVRSVGNRPSRANARGRLDLDLKPLAVA